MLPDKSDLLDLINTVIRSGSCKKKPEHNGYCTQGSTDIKEIGEQDKKKLSLAINLEELKKIEARIEALEDQNHRLLYFIHFLYKNFPDLVKEILPEEQQAIGGTAFSPKNGEHVRAAKNDNPSITPREIEVLQLVVKGLCAKEIATMLFISETTVITHKKNLKEKFNARNTVELISKAFTTLARLEKRTAV
jgi:DNA-binding CsgD family transcriptional regulator